MKFSMKFFRALGIAEIQIFVIRLQKAEEFAGLLTLRASTQQLLPHLLGVAK
jgi:hypothetical protein